jgi:hypothetical protein
MMIMTPIMAIMTPVMAIMTLVSERNNRVDGMCY